MSHVLLLTLALGTAGAEPPAPIRCLLVTGGHGFERQPFEALWNALPGITWREVQHPHFWPELKPEAAKAYDVLVLYDLPLTIPDEAKADFVNLLNAGKGLLALHHCLAGYPQWDEYERIIGGRYLLSKRTVAGVEQPASTYHEGVDLPLHICDPQHPVTKDLGDFVIHDEVYGHFVVGPDVTPLLGCANPESDPINGWTKRYGASQVVYLQPGHGPGAWTDPHWRQIVSNAIAWVKAQSGPK
jgi:hypothetical protein